MRVLILLTSLWANEPPPESTDPGPIVEHHCCVSGDYNRDGSIDGQDIEDFWGDWTDQVGGDVNCDLRIDSQDIAEFFVAWETGEVCP